MENMVVRSILAMFVCLSMAACGQSKGDSAPVHLGNNAKTNQTAGQATATATDNDQTGRQPTTSAQASAADLSNLGEPTATATTTLADGTTSTLNKYADGTKVTTVTHLNGEPATVTVDKSAVIQGPQAQKAAANQTTNQAAKKVKAVQKSVTAPAGGYHAAGSAAASNKQAAATKKQKENPIATSDDESTGQLNRMSAEADKYTGSADDYLRNFLISKENKASDVQKSRDLQTANSVRAAALKVDYRADDGGGSGDMALSLTVSQNGKDRSLVLGGTINNGRGRLQASSKSVAVKGEVICMDANATTCETAVADLVVGTSSKSTLRIIFRRTDVNMTAKFPNKSCLTQECEDIYTMFAETGAYDRGALNTTDRLMMSKAKMESFEVINGRSGFRLIMTTMGNELITFGGPLFNQDLMSAAAVNVPADRTINVEDQVNFVTGQNYKTRLNNNLKDIRIVGNDGLGTVTVNVTASGQQQVGLQDHFQLVITRVANPLRPIIGMNLAGK